MSENTMATRTKPRWLKPVIGVVAALLVVGTAAGAYAWLKPDSTTAPAPEPEKKRIVEPVNIIPVSERPTAAIRPEADGRNLIIEVSHIKKDAATAEYELEYQAGELLQGVNGQLSLASLPASTKQLMGSCSAGGKCSYHEDVRGGTLVLRMRGGSESYSVKQDWKYIDNAAKESAISSKDAKFQLESNELITQRYIVVYNSPGYPEEPPGTVASDPYSLTTSSVLSGEGELIMRANEEGNLAIAGWDGREWQTFSGTTDGKMITATVDLLPLYVVISQ